MVCVCGRCGVSLWEGGRGHSDIGALVVAVGSKESYQ